jgi:IS5 family transposase
MVGERRRQKSFADIEFVRRVPDDHFLMEIERLVDWEPFEKRLKELYHPRTGRPSYPPMVMFKALLLQQWYGLSDSGLEEAIADRFSFHRFLGIGMSDPVPDETTICRFRNKLAGVSLSEKLFRILDEQLEARDLFVRKVTLVDATLVEAARRPPRKGEKGKDEDAAYTVKGRKPHYGYKAHAGVNDGFIRKMEVTPANVHDSMKFNDLIQGDEDAVFADKGYYKESRKHTLRRFGIYCGIMDKAARNNPLSNKQKKRNRRISRVRAGVERSFGTMKRTYGMARVRYVGLIKNRGHFYILAMAMNLKRMLKLAPAC